MTQKIDNYKGFRKSTEVKKRKMIKAMKMNFGNISKSSKQANISRKTHYRWLESDKKYEESINLVLEQLLDVVDGILMDRILEGNVSAIIFYLKTKGKHRGYDMNCNSCSTSTKTENLKDMDINELIKILKR